MFGRKKQQEEITYDRQQERPVIHSSICTGERVAGFKDMKTGKFRDFMLIRTEEDLDRFATMCRVPKEEIRKEY